MDNQEIVAARIGDVTVTRNDYLNSVEANHLTIDRPSDARVRAPDVGDCIYLIYVDGGETERTVSGSFPNYVVDWSNRPDPSPETLRIALK